MNALITDHFKGLVDEIQSTFTERVAAAREEVILAHHETGKLIHEYLKDHDMRATLLVKHLVEANAAGETTLWLCHDFYEKFPNYNDIDKLGHGKNVSWNKIRLALRDPEKKEVEKCVCTHCGNQHAKKSA